jgi:hypothetical protein
LDRLLQGPLLKVSNGAALVTFLQQSQTCSLLEVVTKIYKYLTDIEKIANFSQQPNFLAKTAEK